MPFSPNAKGKEWVCSALPLALMSPELGQVPAGLHLAGEGSEDGAVTGAGPHPVPGHR